MSKFLTISLFLVLCSFCYGQQRPEQSIPKDVLASIKAREDEIEVLLNNARMLVAKGSLTESRPYYERALDLSKSTFVEQVVRAEWDRLNGRYALALQEYLAVKGMWDDDVDLWIVVMQCKLNMLDEARDAIKTYVRVDDPDDTELYGIDKQLLPAYSSSDFTSIEATALLLLSRMADGKHQQLLRLNLVKQAHDLVQDSPCITFQLARAYAMNDNYAAAIDVINRSATLMGSCYADEVKRYKAAWTSILAQDH